MKKMTIVTLCLSIAVGITGCSSQSRWVKNGSSDYDVSELKTAMKNCNYKYNMQGRSSVTAPWDAWSDPEAMSEEERQRRTAKDSDSTLEWKAQGLQFVKSAYECMEKHGFERSLFNTELKKQRIQQAKANDIKNT